MAADRAVVCDASVLAAIAFGDRDSDEARALTRRRRLYAPSLLRYEMAEVAVRRGAGSGTAAPLVDEAFAASLKVPVRLLEPSWPAVVELARTHGLTAYDAAYLHVALELRVCLATLDRRLGRVAERLGVKADLQP
jgi:predicted nucleic acid-binding protein